MCGIAGIVGAKNLDSVMNMLNAIKHRGPDDCGIFKEDVCILGHVRLSIIDLTGSAHQPMISNDCRYVIVFNGEIYNFHELKSELIKDGYSFKSKSDTEVVLYSYLKWGTNCVENLRGMFSFAIWDNEKKSLFAARDHLGIKPFLYSIHKNILIFCSELKGIINSGFIEKTIDEDSLADFFITGHVNQPKTIYSNVKHLLPGHTLEYINGEILIKKYWDLPIVSAYNDIKYNDVVEKTRNLVDSSIKEELISDVPVGVFLSGGLDSSIIVASIKAQFNSNIDTFSIGFNGEADNIDETSHAKMTADYFGTKHYEIKIQSEDIRNDFEQMIQAFDQPVAMDAYNTYLVSKYASKHVKVALSGLGGDEVFAGYRHFPYLLKNYLSRNFKNKFIEFSKPIWRSVIKNKDIVKNLELLSAIGDIPAEYAFINWVFSPLDYCNLTGRDPGNGYKIYLDKIIKNFRVLDEPTLTDPLQRISRLSLKNFMTYRLLRDSDCVSMYNSIELRVPLIDKRIIELIFPLQWNMKLRNGLNYDPNEETYLSSGFKGILVDAYRDILPNEILYRKKKGFEMPVKKWISRQFEDKIDEHFSQKPISYFDRRTLLKIKSIWEKNKSNHAQVWTILVFSEWSKQQGLS